MFLRDFLQCLWKAAARIRSHVGGTRRLRNSCVSRSCSKSSGGQHFRSSTHILSERGYFGATVGEIAERSGLALGSIYRYFDNKEDIFLELLESLVEELFPSVNNSWVKDKVLESLRESSRRYLTTYYNNRHFIAGLLEMSAAVPACAERWWKLRQKTFSRKAQYLQKALANDVLQPDHTATALATMVEQLAYHWYVESEKNGGESPDLEVAAETISLIWYRAIYAGAEKD
ncbi:TetR/AcrR family transcriptional regulator [Pseudomonas mosselii]|uniref:TetR/AcrR family transcriptional regulator n=1 Tax=Pseudomonas mosselii TaxID=78327 RepID=A0AA42RW70_9PSED|nr:TetR/AcrR family transcriptional regulator [Pseudomonas mosselii]MDH1629555.1 TetR/AcrR family transcriptional regulator [Pseudomonas mosselii]